MQYLPYFSKSWTENVNEIKMEKLFCLEDILL